MLNKWVPVSGVFSAAAVLLMAAPVYATTGPPPACKLRGAAATVYDQKKFCRNLNKEIAKSAVTGRPINVDRALKNSVRGGKKPRKHRRPRSRTGADGKLVKPTAAEKAKGNDWFNVGRSETGSVSGQVLGRRHGAGSLGIGVQSPGATRPPYRLLLGQRTEPQQPPSPKTPPQNRGVSGGQMQDDSSDGEWLLPEPVSEAMPMAKQAGKASVFAVLLLAAGVVAVRPYLLGAAFGRRRGQRFQPADARLGPRRRLLMPRHPDSLRVPSARPTFDVMRPADRQSDDSAPADDAPPIDGAAGGATPPDGRAYVEDDAVGGAPPEDKTAPEGGTPGDGTANGETPADAPAPATGGTSAVAVSERAVPGLVRLLGGYSAEGPGGRVESELCRDSWALLGLLAENRGAWLHRESMYARMRPDADPSDDRDAFWKPMNEARTWLVKVFDRQISGPEAIARKGQSSYRVNEDLFTFDVWQLRDALTQVRTARGAEKAAALRRAVQVYTGPYLPGCEYEFAQTVARALDREVITALAQLAGLCPPEEAILYLERATGIDPTAEHLYQERMKTYAALNRGANIHACFQELTDALGALKMTPSKKTRQDYQHLTKS